MNHQGKFSRQVAALVCAIALGAPLGAALAAQETPTPAVTMAPGVLVGSDQQGSVAWIADAKGRVTSINLNDGKVRWRSATEGLPLAQLGQQLVVLARPKGPGQLSLLLINPEDGTAQGGLIGNLPDGVLASPDPQPNRLFKAIANSEAGMLKIQWSYVDWPLRGAILKQDLVNGRKRRELGGMILVDFAASRMQVISDADLPSVRTPDLIGDARIAGVEGVQFRAADDVYAQVSTAVSDDLLGTQWRWTVHERASGRSVANLILPYANAPFLVRAGQLLWQSQPLVVREASGGYASYAARLVALDLRSGRELWSADVLDGTYRGVLPP